ncbi:MAG TPA: alpha/beta hydrolase [Rhizomicrobium sp.]|nr:alpha/beta hydrolase [Rhizomicrobium sp.]
MPRIRANGIDIEYETFGRETDPAMLLIMGFAAQLTMWPLELCEDLAARGFRVIRFDNRDIGKSTHLAHLGQPDMQELVATLMSGKPASAPYALDDMAADAAALLEALDISKAHIVGASMGGMIAQLVAANFPARTKSLVSIMSTTGRRDLPMGKPEAMAALTTPPASDSLADRIEAGIRVGRALMSPGYPTPDEELRTMVTEAATRAAYDPAGVARQMAAIVAAPPRNDILKGVAAPTLVIHGADDPILTVEGGKDTAASVPGARLEIVPGMAHDFPKGLIPTYVTLIADFASGVEARKAA